MTDPTNQQSSIARLMQRRMFWVLILLILAATLIFRHLPAIDIEVARLFYDDGFSFAADPFWRGLRRATINFTVVLVVLLLLGWLYRLFSTKGGERLPFTKLAFPTLSLLLGPLIVTNLIFKNNWGRPRPRELEIFGGEATHILPWDMSDQCISNCSFVSGETSSAVWLVTLIPLLPLAWHSRALFFVALYTLFVSTLRIAFGGHFLSDVVFSILLNLLAFWVVWGLFFARTNTIQPHFWANETRAAGVFQKAGKPLQPISRKLMLAYSALMNKVRRKSR